MEEELAAVVSTDADEVIKATILSLHSEESVTFHRILDPFSLNQPQNYPEISENFAVQ